MEQLPKEPSPEAVDAEIENLLKELNNYAEIYDEGSPELQEEWYWIEMEAKVAKDRQAAKAHLEEFISKIKELKEKS